jgi:hypothetical protein
MEQIGYAWTEANEQVRYKQGRARSLETTRR